MLSHPILKQTQLLCFRIFKIVLCIDLCIFTNFISKCLISFVSIVKWVYVILVYNKKIAKFSNIKFLFKEL